MRLHRMIGKGISLTEIRAEIAVIIVPNPGIGKIAGRSAPAGQADAQHHILRHPLLGESRTAEQGVTGDRHIAAVQEISAAFLGRHAVAIIFILEDGQPVGSYRGAITGGGHRRLTGANRPGDAFQPIRRRDAVGIDEYQNIPLRQLHPAIARHPGTGIERQTVIGRPMAAGNLLQCFSYSGTGVIDDNDLTLPDQIIFPQGFQAALQFRHAAVNRDDH